MDNRKIRALANVKLQNVPRKYSDLPYIVHPATMVNMLLSWGEPADSRAIAIAWGHDLREETDVTPEKIIAASDEYVWLDIELLSFYGGDKQVYLENIAERGNRDVLLVKMTDRICNALDFLSEGKAAYAREYLHKADCIYHACLHFLKNMKGYDITLWRAFDSWNNVSALLLEREVNVKTNSVQS